MDLVASCKDKLSHFRIKELKDVLAQLRLSKQGKKQDLAERILSALSDGQGLSMARNGMGRDEVAKLVDDTYRRMQVSGATEVASKSQGVSETSNVKLKEEVADSYQPEKIRCPCGSTLPNDSMIKCEDSRCGVWQHITCVIIPEKPTEGPPQIPADTFYCERCRSTRADPFWATMAHPLSSVKLVITSVPADGMSDVPDEILREILSRLPVAPLLRFRCVSKSWKSLIEDQQFSKHHLNHSRKTNSNLNIILADYDRLYSVDFDLLNETNMATFQKLTLPLEASNCKTDILGSCDGLLLLRNDKYDVTILWNPSVRRFHEIPVCGNKFPGYNKNFYYGFGYDVVRDDYKLIRIVQFYGKDGDEFNSEVKVYSVKSDSWRRIPDFPYKIITTHGVLANCALRWIVSVKVKPYTDKLVAAIDLGTEEFRLVPLPKFPGGHINEQVVVFGGCLSLICCVNDDHVDVWVMKEFGVQESWSILFAVDTSSDTSSDFVLITPLAYSKCGRKVLLGWDDVVLMWYDLDKKSTDVVPMCRMAITEYDMYTCLQSLVLLSNGVCDFDIVTKKKRGRKYKKRSWSTRND